MDIAADLECIAIQEEVFVFEKFDASVAWDLGMRIKAIAERRGVAVAFDITVSGASLFYFGMPGTTLDNADWIRRKRNVSLRFQRASYAVGLRLEREKMTLHEAYGASASDYAAHGGAFPIRVKNAGMVGTVTVSGVPQREDHGIVVEALAEFFGKSLSGLALAGTGAVAGGE